MVCRRQAISGCQDRRRCAWCPFHPVGRELGGHVAASRNPRHRIVRAGPGGGQDRQRTSGARVNAVGPASPGPTLCPHRWWGTGGHLRYSASAGHVTKSGDARAHANGRQRFEGTHVCGGTGIHDHVSSLPRGSSSVNSPHGDIEGVRIRLLGPCLQGFAPDRLAGRDPLPSPRMRTVEVSACSDRAEPSLTARHSDREAMVIGDGLDTTAAQRWG